jgi:hypothetical protein
MAKESNEVFIEKYVPFQIFFSEKKGQNRTPLFIFSNDCGKGEGKHA